MRARREVRNGAPPNMPSFEETLTDAEIEAVADYVSEVTGGNAAR